MGSIRTRKENGLLMFDFRYQGVRCREQTTLPDTSENRKRMEKVLKKIEAEITLDSFDYSAYFPNSPLASKFAAAKEEVKTPEKSTTNATPLFEEFAWTWYDENSLQWKFSYKETLKVTFNRYLIPEFKGKEVGCITKAEILKFRSTLAKVPNGTKTGLSADRINHIMTPLRMIMAEAADRYNFTTPCNGIKQLRVPKTDVDPFTLEETNLFLANVRPDFFNYYTVRFFTGMRTGEIDGLKWQYVNFDRREIYIRETIVFGREDTAKTQESHRTIQMSSVIYQALKSQQDVTGKFGKFVFCNRKGDPLNYQNVSNRIWYPTLKRLGIKRRTPYQTRHTTATLWLAAGENPEWIARQMGHVNTRMLFTVYSRFVPNLTRQDGSAFDKLLSKKVGTKGGA
ncbi:site-specific integrase [Geobacter pelophilus]|uniref:Site-specific integrase n=1 Tax=Geoanaerobacter pelophilus TaxID=60036 RepID=A0AAW4L9K4_9BACT|nr:site-specific integrase [Geoanaerobacter pelophilus]MBT0666222.1 site-specific integrase [Geoanaerobacter pelophilus]